MPFPLCCPRAVFQGSARPPVRRDLQWSAGCWRVWSCSSPWCLLCSRRCPGEVEVSPCAEEQCSACPTPCYRGHGQCLATALPVGMSPRSCQGRGCSCGTQMPPLPGTFFLSLPQGVNLQASRAACRHVYRLEKHTEISDRKGVAVERQKGLGKRLSSLLSRSIGCCRCRLLAHHAWTPLPGPNAET